MNAKIDIRNGGWSWSWRDAALYRQRLAVFCKSTVAKRLLLKQLTKAILERALNAELREHLGFEKHEGAGRNSGNSRNGTTPKTLKGDFGELTLEEELPPL